MRDTVHKYTPPYDSMTIFTWSPGLVMRFQQVQSPNNLDLLAAANLFVSASAIFDIPSIHPISTTPYATFHITK